MDCKNHWQEIYKNRAPAEVSWYQDRPEKSLHLIRMTGLAENASIIDVGGGASILVDHLLREGFKHLTVLDISGAALSQSKERLGSGAAAVEWIEADITRAALPSNAYDLWHDRAVFHFLTIPADRKSYVEVLAKSLKSDGHVIMAAFALDGPPRCSGLEVRRYSPETLAAELGPHFKLLKSDKETHQTPFDTTQEFIYAHFVRQ
jgi:ubiquinone/menaquinone biosynthesis C-methylase UbiE